MAVPKAAVNEDDFQVAGENKIRPARKVLHVQPEPEPKRMGDAADGYFGTGVFTTDPRHAVTALTSRKGISQLIMKYLFFLNI